MLYIGMQRKILENSSDACTKATSNVEQGWTFPVGIKPIQSLQFIQPLNELSSNYFLSHLILNFNYHNVKLQNCKRPS